MDLPKFKLDSEILSDNTAEQQEREADMIDLLSAHYIKDDRETFCRWVMGLIQQTERQASQLTVERNKCYECSYRDEAYQH